MTSKSLDEERLLRSSEVAEKIGVCKRTIYMWAYDGLNSLVTVGHNSRRFVHSEIEAWLETHKGGEQ